MRFLSAVVATLFLLGCQQQSEQSPAEAEQNVRGLVVANDPMACSAPEALSTVFSIARPDYAVALQNGMTPIRVTTVSATGVNKDINEISCSANGHSRSAYIDGEAAFRIDYKLRPALDQDATFVADVLAISDLRQRIGAHLYWWSVQQNQVQNVPVSDERTTPKDDSFAPARKEQSTSNRKIRVLYPATLRMNNAECFEYSGDLTIQGSAFVEDKVVAISRSADGIPFQTYPDGGCRELTSEISE